MSETTEDVRLCMHGNGNRAMCQLCILEDFQMRTPAEFAFALAAARREVETVNEEAERQAGVICNLNTDLATSRAALEDVRRVEKWLAKDFQLGRYVKTTGSGKLVAIEEDPDMAVVAISLEALGRALAQEAGDAMR